MKIMKSMIIAAVTATMAFAPQSGMCQKGNPRGIYKLTSVHSSKATVTDCKDQYKVCTDSITLNIVVDNATHWFNFSRNKVYNYTGATPAYQADKSDLIYDSSKKGFTLKWWVREEAGYHKMFPYYVPNEWCVEKYQAGKFSQDGKIIFDAITKLQKPDKKNRIIGTWRTLGTALSLNKSKIDSVRNKYPQSPTFNKRFYVFTPTHWLLTLDTELTIIGQFNSIKYLADGSFTDNVSVVPTKPIWLTDDLVCLSVEGLEKYILLERVNDGIPVLNRIAYWFVPHYFY